MQGQKRQMQEFDRHRFRLFAMIAGFQTKDQCYHMFQLLVEGQWASNLVEDLTGTTTEALQQHH